MSRGDLKTRILIVVLLATVSACSNEPRCDRSPRDRLPDSVILEQVRQYAFQRESEDRKGSLEDAVRDGRVKWGWKAAPGMKYPNEYGSRDVYVASAIVTTYNEYDDSTKVFSHTVPIYKKNNPGIFRMDIRLNLGFDACGNLIGGI
jgi:hypothetical protein